MTSLDFPTAPCIALAVLLTQTELSALARFIWIVKLQIQLAVVCACPRWMAAWPLRLSPQ